MAEPRRIKVLFVERHPSEGVSIERVFDRVRRSLDPERFDCIVQKTRFRSGPIGVFLNLLTFRPKRADVYHITGHVNYLAIRLPRRQTILTVHDLIAIRRHSGLRNFLIRKLFIDIPLSICAEITAISRSTRSQILEYFDHSPGKSWGIADKITVIANPLTIDAANREREYAPNGVLTVLHIGTAPNKNLDNLVEALVGSSYRLRIIGPMSDTVLDDIRSRGILVEAVKSVAKDAMLDEYQRCDILSFCSTYEGFGLPIIEANAASVPVITSDRPPMSEVAGDAALRVDPDDPIAIRNGIDRIANDPGLRKQLTENGAKNIERFDPVLIASQYAEIYEKIFSGIDPND